MVARLSSRLLVEDRVVVCTLETQEPGGVTLLSPPGPLAAERRAAPGSLPQKYDTLLKYS